MRQGFSKGIGDRVDWTRLIAVIGQKLGWLVVLDMFSGVSCYLWLLVCLLPKIVLVKKVGFMYRVSWLFCLEKLCSLRC